MHIATNTYPTDFGDLAEPDASPYSRVTLSVPVTRPVLAMTIKTFVPIALIVVCAALVFFVRPLYVEGRLGLGITALLTLVALQLTSGASLPEVDYLMMLDKVYLLAYLFIIISLAPWWPPHGRALTLRPRRLFRAMISVWVGVLLLGAYSWQTLPLPGIRWPGGHRLNSALHRDCSSPSLRDRDGRRGQPAFFCALCETADWAFREPGGDLRPDRRKAQIMTPAKRLDFAVLFLITLGLRLACFGRARPRRKRHGVAILPDQRFRQ